MKECHLKANQLPSDWGGSELGSSFGNEFLKGAKNNCFKCDVASQEATSKLSKHTRRRRVVVTLLQINHLPCKVEIVGTRLCYFKTIKTLKKDMCCGIPIANQSSSLQR